MTSASRSAVLFLMLGLSGCCTWGQGPQPWATQRLVSWDGLGPAPVYANWDDLPAPPRRRHLTGLQRALEVTGSLPTARAQTLRNSSSGDDEERMPEALLICASCLPKVSPRADLKVNYLSRRRAKLTHRLAQRWRRVSLPSQNGDPKDGR